MNFPDIWAIVTGLAAILSLFLVVNEKYASWKKFTVPVCAGLVGFAFGRFTSAISFRTENIPSEQLSVIIIVFFVLLVALAVFYIAMKNDQPMLGYAGMLLLVILALPNMIGFFSDDNTTISSGDYIILANYKESVGDYEGSIHYIEKYMNIIKDENVKEELKKKIAELRKRQITDTKSFQSERNKSSGSPTTQNENAASQ